MAQFGKAVVTAITHFIDVCCLFKASQSLEEEMMSKKDNYGGGIRGGGERTMIRESDEGGQGGVLHVYLEEVAPAQFCCRYPSIPRPVHYVEYPTNDLRDTHTHTTERERHNT